MKNFTQHKIFGISWPTIIMCLFFFILKQEMQAQYISNNGAFISISSGTIIGMDTINNDNSAALENNGTLNVTSINNDTSAALENSGTLNVTSINNDNSTTLENSGTLNVTSINNDNSTTLENSGTLNVTSINNDNSSTLENNGTLNVTSIINENGATLKNNGTIIGMDTINNDNSSTLENSGTLNVTSIINAGNIQGDGTYNIIGDFISTGTFFSEFGVVNMDGTSAQTMTMATSTFNKLTIDNAAVVTLNSTQTIITDSLIINSGKIFKIEAAKNLTVTGDIANSGGNEGLVLKSTNAGTAALIHNTDNVPATMQRYISGAAEDWHFLSAPVSDQSISGDWNPTGTYGNGTGYDLYIFNEPTPCWTYQLNTTVVPTWASIHPTSNFVTGRGYLYSTQAPNPTKEFMGLLNNGNVSYPITNESPDPVVKGFNLIGNPYPSSIDWKSVTGWTRTNLVTSGGGYDMWIWNPASNNYGVYSSIGMVGTNGVTQYIPPTQGYLVRASSNGNISMSNAVRVNNGASNWFKTQYTEPNRLKIRITSNEGHGYDEVLLQFGYTQNEAGALKLFSQNEVAPSIYLSDLNKDLSVRYLTDTIENSKIPVQFKAGKNGDYSLSIDAEITAFNELLLEDKKIKIISDLKINSTYEFRGSISDDTDRFVLHFKPVVEDVTSLSALIYYDGNEINVDLTMVDDQTDIKVYDMLGRLLVDKKGAGKMIHRFNINQKQEVYMVVANSKGKSISRMVLVY